MSRIGSEPGGVDNKRVLDEAPRQEVPGQTLAQQEQSLQETSVDIQAQIDALDVRLVNVVSQRDAEGVDTATKEKLEQEAMQIGEMVTSLVKQRDDLVAPSEVKVAKPGKNLEESIGDTPEGRAVLVAVGSAERYLRALSSDKIEIVDEYSLAALTRALDLFMTGRVPVEVSAQAVKAIDDHLKALRDIDDDPRVKKSAFLRQTRIAGSWASIFTTVRNVRSEFPALFADIPDLIEETLE